MLLLYIIFTAQCMMPQLDVDYIKAEYDGIVLDA